MRHENLCVDSAEWLGKKFPAKYEGQAKQAELLQQIRSLQMELELCQSQIIPPIESGANNTVCALTIDWLPQIHLLFLTAAPLANTGSERKL